MCVSSTASQEEVSSSRCQNLILIFRRTPLVCKVNIGSAVTMNTFYSAFEAPPPPISYFHTWHTWPITPESRQHCQKLDIRPPTLFPSATPVPFPLSCITLQQQFPSSHPVNQHKIALTVADHRVERRGGEGGWSELKCKALSSATFFFLCLSFQEGGPWNYPTGLCKAWWILLRPVIRLSIVCLSLSGSLVW